MVFIMKRITILSFFCILLSISSAWAHIGSAGIVVEKQVGKYGLLISVQPPDVVPGVAKVSVFVQQGQVASIGARPIYFFAGDKGAPTHDILTKSADGPYQGDIWLMKRPWAGLGNRTRLTSRLTVKASSKRVLDA